MQHEKEEWRFVLDSEEKYSVSNLGRVKSNGFYDRLNRWKPAKILTPQNNGNGYLFIGIGRNNYKYVHRLVSESFLNLSENNNLHVNHKDGNKRNNNVSNLEVVTRSQNDLHKKRNLEWHRYPILDLETGVFYSNCKELYETFSHLRKWQYPMWKSYIQNVRLKDSKKRFIRL
jgi:hypothetical protein